MEKLTPVLGPYSHYACTDSLVFTSGQIAIDAAGAVYADASVAEQTRMVLNNLQTVLETAGTSLSRAVKLTIYMRNMGDFVAMNEVYREFFPDGRYPARCCVEVAGLADGIAVEIDVIARR